MTIAIKIAGYELRDVLRSRWLIGYGIFFFVVTDALFRFSGGGEKAMLSLINIVLFLIPLVAMVFSTVYLYHAREFIEMLLAQPVGRRQVFGGIYVGLALPLSLVFLAAVAAPFLLHRGFNSSEPGTLAALLLTGCGLNFLFTALAFFIVGRTDDRLRGLGVGVAVWLLLAVLYDGLVLLAVSLLSDHPLEKPLLFLMLANPLDLARIGLLLQFDVSALMGYTGAVFQRFFDRSTGIAIISLALGAWIVWPILSGLRAFEKKDF